MREEGSVLLLVLMVITIILTLSTGLAVIVCNEVRMTSYNENWVKAGYKAEAGVEEAINMIDSDPSFVDELTNKEPVYTGKLETEGDFVIDEIRREDNNLYLVKSIGRTSKLERDIEAKVIFKTSPKFQYLLGYDDDNGDLMVEGTNWRELLFGLEAGKEFEEKVKKEVKDFDEDVDEDFNDKILEIKFNVDDYVKKDGDYIVYKNDYDPDIYIASNEENLLYLKRHLILGVPQLRHDEVVYKDDNGDYIRAVDGNKAKTNYLLGKVIYNPYQAIYKTSKDNQAEKIYKGADGNYYYLGTENLAFLTTVNYQADVEGKIADHFFQTQYDFKEYIDYSWINRDIELPAEKIIYINGDLDLLNFDNSIKSNEEGKPAIVVVNGDLTIGSGINNISDIIFVQNGCFKNANFAGLIDRTFIYTTDSTNISTAAADFSGSIISEKDLNIMTWSSDLEEMIEDLKATFKYTEVDLWGASPIFKDESKDEFFELKVISWDEKRVVN